MSAAKRYLVTVAILRSALATARVPRKRPQHGGIAEAVPGRRAREANAPDYFKGMPMGLVPGIVLICHDLALACFNAL
jgi:hypothetical protein